MSRLDRISEDEWRELALSAQGSVAVLAGLCGVTRRQLERFMRERWGFVPVRWLNEVRLRHAPTLLEQGLLAKEAAALLGYGSASHFAKAFKDYHGVPPSKFKAHEPD
ncbi:MAG: helix-turn-helix domain-containing protein [Limisphaerales bacterium]